MPNKTGQPCRGEYFTASGTGGEMTIYIRDPADDSWAARTLASDERLSITSAYCTMSVTGHVAIHCDTNDDNAVDDGERVVHVPAWTTGGGISHFFGADDPWVGAAGAKPHVLASASGIVTAGFIGHIIKTGA